MNNQTI